MTTSTATPAKKRTNLLRRASALVLALALACGIPLALAGCSSSDLPESVYVATTIVVLDDEGEMEYTETYELDENGSYVGQTRTYAEDEDEDDVTYTFTLNDDGFYTGLTYITYDEDEEKTVDVTEERKIKQSNLSGFPTKIKSTVYHDEDVYAEGTTLYTYYSDGSLKTVSFSEDAEDPYYSFDENGCIESREDEAMYVYTEDDDGLVVSCIAYNDDGDEGYSYEYSYDDDGNVDEVVVYGTDGDVTATYQIEYTLVEDPSLAAIAEASERTYLVGLFPIVL